ncbi:unnamed protein product [Euphydryas editha]|uniref:Uncharacterized protein n=1 Tax=Euphydryas editha TaxID=104508 RepID=A0AAU9V7A6_EUPED|nr:unnamed protein product [Euphydryas editha]
MAPGAVRNDQELIWTSWSYWEKSGAARGKGAARSLRAACGAACGAAHLLRPASSLRPQPSVALGSRSCKHVISCLSPRSSHAEPQHAVVVGASVIAPRHVQLTPASVPPTTRSSHQEQVSASCPPPSTFRTRKRVDQFL